MLLAHTHGCEVTVSFFYESAKLCSPPPVDSLQIPGKLRINCDRHPANFLQYQIPQPGQQKNFSLKKKRPTLSPAESLIHIFVLVLLKEHSIKQCFGVSDPFSLNLDPDPGILLNQNLDQNYWNFFDQNPS